MTDLREELRNIGCHANGDARCTCNIGQDALAEIDRLESELRAVRAERDRAQKDCERIIKRMTPKRLRYAPKDRIIIGVERPPCEDETFFYDLIWCEHRERFVTPWTHAFNGATHFLDPRDMIGLRERTKAER